MQTTIAIVTACIAFIVAVITFRQWKVNKEKLRLDLYDRRFAIYTALLDYYIARTEPSSETRSVPDSMAKAELAFVKAHREACFMFPSESHVYKTLSELADVLDKLPVFKNPRDNTTWREGLDCGRITPGKNYEENRWKADELRRNLEDKIAPYLNFHGFKAKEHWYEFWR